MRAALLTGDTRHGGADWFARGDGALVRLSWLVTPYVLSPGVVGALVLLYKSTQDEADEGDDRFSARLTELDRLALLAETTTQLTTVERLVPTVRDHALRALVMCSRSCFRICPRC